MKIRLMVDGDTPQEYEFERGKQILRSLQQSNLIMDDETRQLTKIEFLTKDSSVTVYPRISGG